MDCKDIKSLISLYVDDVLDNNLRMQVKMHLDICDSCSREYEELNKIWNILGEIEPISPRSDYISRFWTELSLRESLLYKIKKFIQNLFIIAKRRKIVYAVSLLSMFVLVVFNFMNIYEKESDNNILASFNNDDIDMIENIELANNYDVIAQLDIIEKLDTLDQEDYKSI